MVKLTGPGLARAAGGSVAGQLTFSNWKGKPYLKKLTKPKQPRTQGQVAMRAILAFLSPEWSIISAAARATWMDLAHLDQISPFNAYLKENLKRWRSFLRPSWYYPATEDGPIGTIPTTTATGAVRTIHCTADVSYLGECWAYSIYHAEHGTDWPRWHKLRHIMPIHTTGLHECTLTGFPPGTHWLAFNRSNRRGNRAGAIIFRCAIVTD